MGEAGTRSILINESFSLLFHGQYKIVHHVTHMPISGAPFREMLTRGAELLEERRATKWLSDNRLSGALHPEDGTWAMEVWSKRAIAAGWKYWAIVMPNATLGRANIRRFIREYADHGVQSAIFDNPEDALVWLKDPTVAVAV